MCRDGNAAHGLALCGVLILDVLCFVNEHQRPRQFLQLGIVRAQHTVGGEQDVGIKLLQASSCPVIDKEGKRGGETADFRLPVGEQAGGYHH